VANLGQRSVVESEGTDGRAKLADAISAQNLGSPEPVREKKGPVHHGVHHAYPLCSERWDRVLAAVRDHLLGRLDGLGDGDPLLMIPGSAEVRDTVGAVRLVTSRKGHTWSSRMRHQSIHAL